MSGTAAAGPADEPAPWTADGQRTVAAIAAVVVLTGILGGIAFPILPQVAAAAGLPGIWVGMLLAANRVGRLLSSPWVGRAVDRHGGRRVLMAGAGAQLGVVALYTLGVDSAHPGVWLMAGRVLHGPASACVFVSSQALALRLGGTAARARASGTIGAAQAAGVPIGLVVGGLAAGLFGAVAALAACAPLPVLGCLAARRWAPRGGRAIAPVGVPVPLGHMITHPHIVALGLVAALTNLSANGVMLACVAPLSAARGLCPEGLAPETCASLFMMALVGGTLAATPPASRLADRGRGRTPVAAAGAVMLIAGLLVARGADAAPLLATGASLVGLGNGALNTTVYALLGDWVAAPHRGRAVGALQLFADIGGSIGPPLGTALLARALPLPFAVTACLSLSLLPLVWRLSCIERRLAAAATGPTGRPEIEPEA